MIVCHVSIVDSDGDMLLARASIQAPTLQSAWEQAIVIAFRVCQGWGLTDDNYCGSAKA
jgi:hypothetical protein